MSNSIACIDYRNGKVLIAKRKAGGDMGERWEFPGGKIEAGEDYTAAIVREMKEEFGCGVKVFEELGKAVFIHHNEPCSVTAFRVELASDGITIPYTLTEHTKIEWITIDEIENRSFVDSDLRLLPQIKINLNLGE